MQGFLGETRGQGLAEEPTWLCSLGTVAELSGSLITISWLLAGECLQGGGWVWEVGGGAGFSLVGRRKSKSGEEL